MWRGSAHCCPCVTLGIALLVGAAAPPAELSSTSQKEPNSTLPLTLEGTALKVGVLMLPPLAEIEGPFAGRWQGSWAAKDQALFETFIRHRASYIESPERFHTFRMDMDTVTTSSADGSAKIEPEALKNWGGGDGAYYKVTERDAERMLYLMESPGGPLKGWGAALMQYALPRLAPRIDSFGSPMRLNFKQYGKVSPDLFDGLFKTALILASLEEFLDVRGQSPPPRNPTELWAAGAHITGEDVGPAPDLFSKWNIVEVGAGPGLHASALVGALSARTYSIADLPTQQAMQQLVIATALGLDYMSQTFAFVPCMPKATSDMILAEYDLFVSTYALSELHPVVRRIYFYVFIVRSKRGFIIDNFEDLRKDRARDPGSFIGMDLVRRLHDFGYDVRIATYQQVTGLKPHRSRAMIITWASMGLESMVGINEDDLGELRTLLR